jgi:hypothetical protein
MDAAGSPPAKADVHLSILDAIIRRKPLRGFRPTRLQKT